MDIMIDRTKIKRNFLKEIIIRLDYQGALQAEIDSVVIAIKTFLKDNSFNRYSKKSVSPTSGDGLEKEATGQVVHSFTSDDTGFSIDLSTTAMVLNVRPSGYVPFESYSSIFRHLAKILFEKIDFFNVTRFGLRKINFCFIDNLHDVNKYFKEKYYCIDEPVSNFETVFVKNYSQITDGSKNVHLNHIIDCGELNGKKCYRITLDTDIYSSDESTIKSLLKDHEEMIAANNVLFEAYYNALTEEFQKILCSTNCPLPEGLIGVDDNE